MTSYLEITGGNSLFGEVEISGSKNAALPILAAAIIAKGKHHFSNVPEIEDINVMLQALQMCGVRYERAGSLLTLDTTQPITSEIPEYLTKRFRGGLYLLSSVLARTNRVLLGLPGGCAFDRPFNYHVAGLSTLGAEFRINDAGIEAEVTRLNGGSVSLPFPSLGATCNLIIAGCVAEGTTEIFNSSRAPEVIDLCRYLKGMGAKITGVGTSSIVVTGVKTLIPGNHVIMADRVEAATFLFATAMTGGHTKIRNCPMKLLHPIANLLQRSGVRLTDTNGSIEVYGGNNRKFRNFNLVIGPDPHFWTDWQPHATTFAALCNGESIIEDTYYLGNRFTYIKELRRLGAQIEIFDNTLRIRGPSSFSGTDVIATDIQGGISVVLAGLVAEGVTRVFDLSLIDRGYMALERKLGSLGANVVKKHDEQNSQNR